MGKQIAMVYTPLYDMTGQPEVQHVLDVARFDMLDTTCQVGLSPCNELLELKVGHRRFMVSIMDLAATGAIAVETHLQGEIRQRIASSMPGTTPPANPEAASANHPFGSAGRLN